MNYQQLKPFDPAKAGTVPGRCLGNTTRGFSIPSKYTTARKAWDHTVQHPDTNFPEGRDVPLFWDFEYQGEPDGHVAVQMPDGRVWTDGRYYTSVDDLNTHYLYGKGKYLGWGETLNDVRVIGVNMSADALTREEVQSNWLLAYFRDAPKESLDFYQGKPLSQLQADMHSSKLRGDVVRQYQAGGAVQDFVPVAEVNSVPTLFVKKGQ